MRGLIGQHRPETVLREQQLEEGQQQPGEQEGQQVSMQGLGLLE